MIVNGTLSVKCKKCGHAHDFGDDESDFDVTHTEVRSLGVETTYTMEEKEFPCEGNCGNQIELECEVWEYPPGHYNHQDEKATGGIITDRYTYDFTESDDIE